jgi:acetyl-CoA carboxylase biotin carboxyl carrier protein
LVVLKKFFSGIFKKRTLRIDESVFEKLAEVLKKHELSEIEYKKGETRIRISSVSGKIVSQPVEIVSAQQTTDVQTPKPASQSETPLKTTDYSQHPGAFKSPMVGTCYLSPEPGAKNFVAAGDEVKEGQPILIIEAMKVMNLIKAPKDGKIIHIAVSNATPVEFGQLLAVIE